MIKNVVLMEILHWVQLLHGTNFDDKSGAIETCTYVFLFFHYLKKSKRWCLSFTAFNHHSPLIVVLAGEL